MEEIWDLDTPPEYFFLLVVLFRKICMPKLDSPFRDLRLNFKEFELRLKSKTLHKTLSVPIEIVFSVLGFEPARSIGTGVSWP